MNKIILLLFSIVSFSLGLQARQVINVTESTLRIEARKEEIFYYGFADGDRLIFNFEEVNGKELTQLEITELDGSVRFADHKTRKIKNKTLQITKKGIYKFRFFNSGSSGRICKIRIQRIPASKATKDFNSAVYWKEIYDTSYYIGKKKFLVQTDTVILNLTDQVAKVHARGNINGNRSAISFTLPENTIAWSYYIGVDQAGQQAFNSALVKLNSRAIPILLRIPDYGPLAALALGGISYLSHIQSGEDIGFYVVNPDNGHLFLNSRPFKYLKKGNVINDFSRMPAPLMGTHTICFANDNAFKSVLVTVKITAVTVHRQWETREVNEMLVTSRQEARIRE